VIVKITVPGELLKTTSQSRKSKRPAVSRIVPSQDSSRRYRISGHESFACRYAWLPKLVKLVKQDPVALSDDEKAMVEMGLGRNMVRSARFWGQATGVLQGSVKSIVLTEFGDKILGTKGLDRFLEDIRTLWLIHWRLSTNIDAPLLAWDFLLNHWQEPEITPSTVVKALHKEANRQYEKLSLATVDQHWNVFLHTYLRSRTQKGQSQEDSLDCPLVDLKLLVKIGERHSEQAGGMREPIYSFRRDEKPEISPGLFAYCLSEYISRRHPNEATIPFCEVAHGHGSPGQVFKLPEEDIRKRLEDVASITGGMLTYVESAHLQQVHKSGETDTNKILREVYRQ
jgi:hypothetical protein